MTEEVNVSASAEAKVDVGVDDDDGATGEREDVSEVKEVDATVEGIWRVEGVYVESDVEPTSPKIKKQTFYLFLFSPDLCTYI